MFSGIVEETGTVTEFGKNDGKLIIAAGRVVTGNGKLGVSDSISVSGACLTVTEIQSNWFSVDVVPETMRQTWFFDMRVGSHVNLERALRYGDRVGGHLVQGHVEGVGQVVSTESDRDAKLITIECPEEQSRYIVEKGFIAVDGVSLTCFDCTPTSFTFTLIPYTAIHTTLGGLRAGDLVNIETDMTGKYVERFISK